jgi:hypothetical protein
MNGLFQLPPDVHTRLGRIGPGQQPTWLPTRRLGATGGVENLAPTGSNVLTRAQPTTCTCSFHEKGALTCKNMVRPFHAVCTAQATRSPSKALNCENGDACRSRIDELRTTRNPFVASTILIEYIGARQAVHNAQSAASRRQPFAPRTVPRQRSTIHVAIRRTADSRSGLVRWAARPGRPCGGVPVPSSGVEVHRSVRRGRSGWPWSNSRTRTTRW